MAGAAGRRCSSCSFIYPLGYDICAICGNSLWSTYSFGPDEDWEEQLSWKLRSLGENVPDLSGWAELVAHKEDNTATLTSTDGVLWVEHDALLECGYLNLTEDFIVFLDGEFYELQGYHRPTHRWWIEQVEIDASELTPEQIIGYGAAPEA